MNNQWFVIQGGAFPESSGWFLTHTEEFGYRWVRGDNPSEPRLTAFSDEQVDRIRQEARTWLVRPAQLIEINPETRTLVRRTPW